jgi:hypothetical protein
VVRRVTPGSASQPRDDLEHAPGGDAAAHRAQDAVVAVLHRHVEIRHHARALPLRDQALGDVRGMEIHGPDPGHRGVGERQQQVADVAVAGEVPPVGQRVLRDQDGLLEATAGQPLDLGHHVVQPAAAMTAAELGDRTERAAHVAALGDLHVGVRHP